MVAVIRSMEANGLSPNSLSYRGGQSPTVGCLMETRGGRYATRASAIDDFRVESSFDRHLPDCHPLPDRANALNWQVELPDLGFDWGEGEVVATALGWVGEDCVGAIDCFRALLGPAVSSDRTGSASGRGSAGEIAMSGNLRSRPRSVIRGDGVSHRILAERGALSPARPAQSLPIPRHSL